MRTAPIIENSFNSLLLGNRINGSQPNTTIVMKGNSLVEASNNIIKTGDMGNTITLESTSVLNISNSIIFNHNTSMPVFSGGFVKGKNNIICGRIYSNVEFYYSSVSENYTNFYNFFIDVNNSNFHLAPGSPAIRSGENGTDMGIYGGDNPFVDGGYPSIPSIYYLDVPLIGTQKEGINVTIKAKSNN